MAFMTTTDIWGLATASSAALVAKGGVDDQVSIPINAVAKDADGNVTARGTAGEDHAVKNSFAIKTDIADLSSILVLGDVKGSSEKYLLTEFSLTFRIEQPPQLDVSGVSVQSDASAEDFRSVTLPTLAVATDPIAQDPLAGITLSGDGCDINEVTITGRISPVLTKPAGVVVAYGFGGGEIEVQYKIVQSDSTAPTIAAAAGWTITAGPSKGEPEGDYDVWNVTVVKDVDGANPA